MPPIWETYESAASVEVGAAVGVFVGVDVFVLMSDFVRVGVRVAVARAALAPAGPMPVDAIS